MPSVVPQMSSLEIPFRLPLDGLPRAVFRTDYGYRGGVLLLDGHEVLRASSREELAQGVTASANGAQITAALAPEGDVVKLLCDGREAAREDTLRARPTRSAWIHAYQALGGSAAGFIASFFYLLRAEALQSEWALKMARHMAGWHLLLTFTLFPASVWGQRLGIRSVQLVSLIFFCIHVGIATANLDMESPPIAFFNAVSGVLFLVATLYGQKAHREMDPIKALREGRTVGAKA